MNMHEDQVIIPDDVTIEQIKQDPSLIEYACDHEGCGYLLTETDRQEAYNRIESDNDAWRCIKGADIAEPEDVGFILSAFPLPKRLLAKMAKTILKARAGDLSAKRDLAQGIKAVNYEEELSDRKEDATTVKPLRVEGKINMLWLLGIVLCVALTRARVSRTVGQR